MLTLLAQAAITGTIGQWVITAIIVAAILAILMILVRAWGIQIPPWVIQIGWICLVAVIAVVAIRFLLRL
jgi:hypothetical protein